MLGERAYKHQQYLSGSLFCARCGSRLQFGVTNARRGGSYELFFCAGRHSGRTSRDLPWLPLEQSRRLWPSGGSRRPLPRS